ncbi:MAG: polysaccharide deacetylase family protein, partial [Anaerolineaceae bacterium]|nr:polysaccharide deacetylase family protein [Anaerolineaceae bacterium]
PPRPVVITFDDGNESVYIHAFPIMERYGFVGTFYLVANRVDRNKFVNREQMRTMLDAGWEIGSHSLTHADLTQDIGVLRSEVWESGQILSEAFDTPVTSFAYPFGVINPFVVERTERYGYRAAVGLGTSFQHDLTDLFYLARIEIRNEYDLNRFVSLLPWQSAVGE